MNHNQNYGLYTNIVILPMGNGRALFILVRKNYVIKCREHTNHGSYQLQDKDPTTKMEFKTLNQLKLMKNSKIIDKKLYNYLNTIDSPTPKFYEESNNTKKMTFLSSQSFHIAVLHYI